MQMTNESFSYESHIRQKLEPHPFGRTTEELEASLPSDAEAAALHDALESLTKTGTVKRIGETWRWMQF